MSIDHPIWFTLHNQVAGWIMCPKLGAAAPTSWCAKHELIASHYGEGHWFVILLVNVKTFPQLTRLSRIQITSD